jgi:hypothetical protein
MLPRLTGIVSSLLLGALTAFYAIQILYFSGYGQHQHAFAYPRHEPQRYGSELTVEKPDERIADYTWWLTAFTLALAAISAFQGFVLFRSDRTASRVAAAAHLSAKAALDGLDHTKDVDVTTQRAYMGRLSAVQLRPFTTLDGKRVDRVEYTPIWENNGQTPAINVTFCALESIICAGDNDIPGTFEPVRITMGAIPKIAIGSRQTMQGGSVAIKIDDAIRCSRRECRIFIVFRIEYRDVFPATPIRVTQYCEEMRFSGAALIDDTPHEPFPWPFTLYGHPRFQIFS